MTVVYVMVETLVMLMVMAPVMPMTVRQMVKLQSVSAISQVNLLMYHTAVMFPFMVFSLL